MARRAPIHATSQCVKNGTSNDHPWAFIARCTPVIKSVAQTLNSSRDTSLNSGLSSSRVLPNMPFPHIISKSPFQRVSHFAEWVFSTHPSVLWRRYPPTSPRADYNGGKSVQAPAYGRHLMGREPLAHFVSYQPAL